MDTDVIRSFLVSLGFHVDEGTEKKFNEALEKNAKKVKLLGLGIIGTATAVTTMVARYANGMEKLYYLSQRTHASVANIQALDYAAKQFGLSADGINSSLSSMMMTLRMNPGSAGLLHSLGVQTRGAHGHLRDTSAVMMDFINRTRHMPFYVAARWAQQFGISPSELVLLRQNYGKIYQAANERRGMARAAGINPNKMASESAAVDREWRRVEERVGILIDKMEYRFLPTVMKVLKFFDRIAQDLTTLDDKTGGWSTRIIALVSSLAAMKTAMGSLRLLFPSMAEAGESAASKLMGAIAPIATTLAAIAAAAYGIKETYDAITTGHDSVSDWLNKELGKATGHKNFNLGRWAFYELHPHAGRVHITQHNHIQVHGAGDAHGTAHAVSDALKRPNADLIRNTRGAVR